MTDKITIYIVLLSSFLIVYHHLVYPIVLKFIHKYKAKYIEKITPRYYTANTHDKELPTISLVVPAYNEQHWIAEKIRNIAVLDYPSDKLNIIIACDGCHDYTASIANNIATLPECSHMNIEIREYDQNRGKVSVLNDVLQDLDTDLVALSDVSALISIDALLIAATRFKDPKIGVLNGSYLFLNSSSMGEQAYWKYQSRIKECEASLGSTLGSHGAFYMFRRELFTPLASDTINDDFILPMKIVIAGFRSEYEHRIHALELEKADSNMDHHRRRRIAAGNFQQLLRLKNLMLPKFGGVAFAFISGKGLRVLMPFLMLTALIGSIILSPNHITFAILATLQLSLYLLAAWQLLLNPKCSSRIMHLLGYLVGGHIASLIGVLRYLFGLERGYWKRVK